MPVILVGLLLCIEAQIEKLIAKNVVGDALQKETSNRSIATHLAVLWCVVYKNGQIYVV